MRDLKKLTREQRQRFLVALGHFISDLQEIEAGRLTDFRHGLRVKPLTDVPDVMEMTWAPDGRATFSIGSEMESAKRRVRWRRCGARSVLRRPWAWSGAGRARHSSTGRQIVCEAQSQQRDAVPGDLCGDPCCGRRPVRDCRGDRRRGRVGRELVRQRRCVGDAGQRRDRRAGLRRRGADHGAPAADAGADDCCRRAARRAVVGPPLRVGSRLDQTGSQFPSRTARSSSIPCCAFLRAGRCPVRGALRPRRAGR